MEILNLSLPATNRFASNYLEQSEEIQPFFHYRYNDKVEDVRRLAELNSRTFPRESVAAYIESFMSRFPISEAVTNSITRLRQENSVVVIGGQQAGILTGPLYSIHKVISIIKLAHQKEKELGIPVIPVFWIAGEDHDYQEVNHIFVPVEEKAEKWTYPEKVLNKKMVSDIILDKQICMNWVKNVIENFGETEHTNALLQFAEVQVERSITFVDFFSNIIMELFKDYGLLIVDSGDTCFREIQSEFLSMQVREHETITLSVLNQQKQISLKGFPLTIDVHERAANLFYYDKKDNERILLEFDPEIDCFVGKSGTISLAKAELLEFAQTNPGKLSNNVVTRPLMQEWLFPSIAFIAGPGEIAYWAELKLVFEHFNIKMPPIVPRLNITMLDRSIETDINELNLDLLTVLTKGTGMEKDNFLEAIKDKEVEELFSNTKEWLYNQYRNIEAKASELDKGMLPLLKKNENYLIKEIDFMQKKIQDAVKLKHQIMIKKYARVELSLKPEGSPQERIWNVFSYLNQYGLGLMKSLMELDYEFDGKHKVIKM